MKSSLKPADGKTKTYYGGWKKVFRPGFSHSGEIFLFYKHPIWESWQRKQSNSSDPTEYCAVKSQYLSRLTKIFWFITLGGISFINIVMEIWKMLGVVMKFHSLSLIISKLINDEDKKWQENISPVRLLTWFIVA